MKKEVCNEEKCKTKKVSNKKKIAIGAGIASVAALIGIGAFLKNKKTSKEKQAK